MTTGDLLSRKFHIETFGCQMNVLDSEKIAGSLKHSGMELVSSPHQADVLILNTCSVREKAVQKVYTRLGEVRRRYGQKKNLIVGVVGCMAQLEGAKILERAPEVRILAGPQKGHVMADLVRLTAETGIRAVDMRMDDDPEPLETVHVLRESPKRAGITISEGCDRLCTFCVVPATRGRERSRVSENILAEARDLVRQGYVEIMLLGQTVNSYRDPVHRDITFAALLRRLAQIEGLHRIRFNSPHPNDFNEDLLKAMVECPQVCNQIHLPVQSGSTRILRAMMRGYTPEKYLRTIEKIRKASRPIAVSTDIIVGFPGEAESDFMDTMSLLEEVQFDSAFSFKYSPRPNTAALTLPGEVPEEEKGRRLAHLQERQKLIQYNKNAAFSGRMVEVLVDEPARTRFSLSGRTTENKVVNFDGPSSLMGKFVPVRITGYSANSLKGALLEGDAKP